MFVSVNVKYALQQYKKKSHTGLWAVDLRFCACVFTYLNNVFLPPCNFWLIFKHFPTKISTFCAAAYHIQNHRNRKFTWWFLKLTLPEKLLAVFYTNDHNKLFQKYQIKTTSILLTNKTNNSFSPNSTCSLFCGSISHIVLIWGYSHVKAYRDALPKWVSFSAKSLRQGFHFSKKQKSLEEGPTWPKLQKNCKISHFWGRKNLKMNLNLQKFQKKLSDQPLFEGEKS